MNYHRRSAQVTLSYFLSAEPVASIFCTATAVGPLLNAIIAYPEINSIFSTIIRYLILKLYQNFVLISENHPYFLCHQKIVNIIVASRVTEHCHARNFDFPVLILKYLNLKN